MLICYYYAILNKELLSCLTLNLFRNEQGSQMAKPNYTFEKRQKEIAKKKKQEEKRLKKIAPQGEQPQDGQPQDDALPAPVDGTTAA